MPDIELLGATYPDVPAVDLPKSGGGTARFYDVSGALCTITVEKDGNNDVYTSDKTAQEVYDALTVGINPVFRFHDTRNSADKYVYVSLDSLQGSANGYELSLSSFQTDAMTAATLSDFFEYVILPTIEKTVSGSTIVITDAVALAAVGLLTAITPTQDLHGYDSPWPAGGGKNLLQLSGRTAITSGSHGTARDFSAPFAYIGITRNNYFLNNRINSYSITDDSVTVNISQSGYGVGLNVSVSAETTYTISYKNKTAEYIGLGYFDANGEYLSNKQFYGTGTWSFTTPANCVNLMVVFSPATNTNVDVTYNDVQLELGSSATSFAPYSNICPISGYSAANIVVSPTASAGDGTTYTVQFSGTCRGGSLDVTSGVLSKRPYYSVYNGESLNGPWMSSMDAYASGTLPTTGAEVVDLGGAFTTEQLTPTTVQILQGENHIWSDTGDTTLTYMAVDA